MSVVVVELVIVFLYVWGRLMLVVFMVLVLILVCKFLGWLVIIV